MSAKVAKNAIDDVSENVANTAMEAVLLVLDESEKMACDAETA